MGSHLDVLEGAISDVGIWRWWTGEDLPSSFQVEFGGVQLKSPPATAGGPPSGLVALRYLKPRSVLFLTLGSGVPQDWPDLLHNDKLEPPLVRHDAFTLTSKDRTKELLARAKSVLPLVGAGGVESLPRSGEVFLGCDAHSIGLIVVAESMVVLGRDGELDRQKIEERHDQWWAYWREYWSLRGTAKALPRDYACEVTIPSA